MVPRAAGRRQGAALTQLNRPDEWVVKREGRGAPNLTLNSGFPLKVSVASLVSKAPGVGSFSWLTNMWVKSHCKVASMGKMGLSEVVSC